MLGVVDKEVVRRLHHRQGWSEQRIARELGHDRATIHKYLAVVVGARESRAQGEGRQVMRTGPAREGCVMQDAATRLDSVRERASVTGTHHWKAVCVEMAHARFGEG